MNESVNDPLRYYDHNVAGTVELCKAMAKNGCKNVRRKVWLVFFLKHFLFQVFLNVPNITILPPYYVLTEDAYSN